MAKFMNWSMFIPVLVSFKFNHKSAWKFVITWKKKQTNKNKTNKQRVETSFFGNHVKYVNVFLN